MDLQLDFNWSGFKKWRYWRQHRGDTILHFFVIAKLFYDNQDTEYSGNEVQQATGLPSGYVYCLLTKIHSEGYITFIEPEYGIDGETKQRALYIFKKVSAPILLENFKRYMQLRDMADFQNNRHSSLPFPLA